YALGNLGRIALRQGDLAKARRLVQESFAMRQKIGDRFGLAYDLDLQGQVATAERQYATARAALQESLRLRHELGDRSGIAESLESTAALAAADGQPERAVRLAGAAAGVREAIGAPPSPMVHAMLDSWLRPARQVLRDEATA